MSDSFKLSSTQFLLRLLSLLAELMRDQQGCRFTIVVLLDLFFRFVTNKLRLHESKLVIFIFRLFLASVGTFGGV